MFDVQAEAVVKAHIEVAHPDQRKQCDQVSAPVRKEQLETRNHQEDGGNVVAEAVFTGEQIKKFLRENCRGLLAPLHAKVMDFNKYFFMRNRPCNTRNRNCQHEKPHKLIL